MAIELNWEDAGTLTVLSGEITFAQMTDLHYKIINDPRYERVQYSIYCINPRLGLYLRTSITKWSLILSRNQKIWSAKSSGRL